MFHNIGAEVYFKIYFKFRLGIVLRLYKVND